VSDPADLGAADVATSGSDEVSFEHVLASRRMCRDYSDQPVPGDVLAHVLRAAFRGPAAGNTAALELLVLRDERVAAYWDVTLPADRRPVFPWPGLLHAPVLVIPVVRPGAYVERYAEDDKVRTGLGVDESAWPIPYWYVDGGAGVMALLLAAEAAGLGALLFGQFQHEEAVAAAFGVPPDRRALGTIALGWPAQPARPAAASARRGRPDPTTLIHDECW
jgi:nitroreductase